MISFDRLYYFQRIARSGSIRKASEELFVSESALSKSLRLLEKDMGCELFYRHGKRLQINENGLFLLSLVNGLVEQAEDLKPKLDKHRGVCSQIVMDSYLDFPADTMLHNVLEVYYPDVQFSWWNAVREPEDHLRDLAEGITDVTIIPVELDDVQKMIPKLSKSGINSILLLLEHLYLSAPWGTSLDDVKSMTIFDTKKERLVRAGGDKNYVTLWYEEILASKHQAPFYHYDISDTTFLKNWTDCTTPFITSSLYLAHKDFISGFSKRHQIRLSDPEAERGIFMFYRNDGSPIIDLFVSTFKQHFYDILMGEDY